MQSTCDMPSFGLWLLVVAALVDISLQAALKGGSAASVSDSIKSKTPISVESQLQELVNTGVLSSAEQSTVNHNPLSHRSSSSSIEPADLARAATLVDAQLKAQQQQTQVRQAQPQQQQVVAQLQQQQQQQRQEARDISEQLQDVAQQQMAVTKADDMPVPEKIEDPLSSLDLTPQAVAEYLLITGDFSGFEQAIHDLLTSNVISADEASRYKDAVGWEYETLLYKLVNVKAASLQEFMQSDQLSPKSNFINRGRSQTVVSKPGKAAAMVPPHKVAAPGVNLDDKLRQLQMRALVEKEETLDELLNVINQNAVESTDVDNYFVGGNLVSKKSSSPPESPAEAVAAASSAASSKKVQITEKKSTNKSPAANQ